MTPGRKTYERDATSSRAVLITGAGLILLIAVAVAVGFLLTRHYYAMSPQHPSMGEVPPRPHLQPNPHRDMLRHKAAKQKLLHQYAWVDREKEIVRIPIERAIGVLVEKRHAKPDSSRGTP